MINQNNDGKLVSSYLSDHDPYVAPMTFVQLHRDSFIRFYGDFALLVNQRTKVDHVFNDRERVYLRPISRTPRSIDEMLLLLEAALPATSRVEIRRNLTRLVQILDAEGYVLLGENPETLVAESKEIYHRPIRSPRSSPIGVPLDPGLHCARYFYSHPTVFAMQMDLTSACNLRCVHCFYPPGRKPKLLPRELAFDILDQLSELGTLSLTLSGGEPLLHPNFCEILEKAAKNDFTITIQTNATTITNEHVSAMVDANVNSVGISVYSLVSEDHDSVTQNLGSLDKTMSAIEMMREAGIIIYVSTHVMQQNRRSYQSVLKWGIDNRVKVVTDLLMLARADFSTDNLACRLSMADTEEVLAEMLCYSDEYGKGADGRTRIDPTSFASQPICGVGTDSISLSAEGHYYPCAGFIGFKLGDARQQRLADVWQNSAELQRLRAVRWSDFSGCTSCEAFKFCSMCLARNFNENSGNAFLPVKQNCQVSHLNRRMVEKCCRSTDADMESWRE